MFEVGFTELLVIFVLALVVLGPEKLPRLAQQVGRWIGRARAMAKQFREQLEDEVNLADMKKWEQTATKPTPAPEPPPAQPAHASSSPYAATSGTDTATPEATATTPETSSVTPDSAAPESPSAPGTPEHQAASTGHHSGPPPEPEAAVYQPPAYATSNGSTPHASSTDSSHTVESPPSHEPVATADEPPARPGDVITHTHERGI